MNRASGFPTCLSPAKTVNVVLASGERCVLACHSSISSRVMATPPRQGPCAWITRWTVPVTRRTRGAAIATEATVATSADANAIRITDNGNYLTAPG